MPYWIRRAISQWGGVLTLIGLATAGYLGSGPPKDFSTGLYSQDHYSAAFDLPESGGAPPSIDKDCADFSSHAQAQAFFDSQGPGDPHRLDGDGDGVACETLR